MQSLYGCEKMLFSLKPSLHSWQKCDWLKEEKYADIYLLSPFWWLGLELKLDTQQGVKQYPLALKVQIIKWLVHLIFFF